MKVENGHNIKVHYRGTLTDGTEFDNSRSRGETLNFQVGTGGMIRGFADAVVGMTIGETKNISIPPDQAYGPVVPEAIQEVEAAAFSNIPDMEVGGLIQGQGPQGPFVAKVANITDSHVTLDLNHPLAGETLNFEIEVVDNVGTPNENENTTTANFTASMKKKELLEIAQARGLAITSRNTKTQILEALNS